MSDEIKEKCAVVAVYNHKEAANIVYLGLYALQHRGQESSGIVSSDCQDHYPEIGSGLVSDIFNADNLSKLKGNIAIGHNRYSTYGESDLKNSLPIFVNCSLGPLALSHNGNLTNAFRLRDKLEKEGSIFRSTVDSEVILHLIAKSRKPTIREKISEALSQLEGSYSIAIMTKDELIIARDPSGFRPLSVGKIGESFVFASETCAFDLVGGRFVREVEPGELIIVNKNGMESFFPFNKQPTRYCIFELIYFARPDSYMFGKDVYSVRKRLGRELAIESPVDADIVSAVPDSGIVAALGFAAESKIRYETAIIRNHYVGRTFIEPASSIRDFGVKVKLNPIKSLVKGKRIVLVDDSIVRGNTSKKLIKMVRDAGAKEIHFRISSPPTGWPCYYGIDTPSRSELIASTYSVEEIKNYLMVDSLAYLSMEGMFKAMDQPSDRFCVSCFSGVYTSLPAYSNQTQIELVDQGRVVVR